ncbi:MAG: C40 family peptidase [Paludibacteraceae bacterium]|nr:C40 family peptidase [Paludibacteraceae bacterium]
MFAINHCTVTPVRQEPSEGSEQLTQLLFGEVCEVLDRLPRWTKIRSTLDGQEGWVDFKMVSLTSSLIASSPHRLEAVVATPMAAATPMDGGADLLLTLGTRLPNYSHGTFEILGQQYLIDPTCVNITTAQRSTGEADLQQSDLQRSDLATIAQSLLNAPYLWGGKNAMGMDCSGFTQVVYAAMGVNLLRNAREQMTQGELVPSLADAQPGDLAFFDHADRDPKATNISHVGLLLSPTEIIHCSGCVHIDTIDEQGIHLSDGELTHHLVQIKRYL